MNDQFLQKQKELKNDVNTKILSLFNEAIHDEVISQVQASSVNLNIIFSTNEGQGSIGLERNPQKVCRTYQKFEKILKLIQTILYG